MSFSPIQLIGLRKVRKRVFLQTQLVNPTSKFFSTTTSIETVLFVLIKRKKTQIVLLTSKIFKISFQILSIIFILVLLMLLILIFESNFLRTQDKQSISKYSEQNLIFDYRNMT